MFPSLGKREKRCRERRLADDDQNRNTEATIQYRIRNGAALEKGKALTENRIHPVRRGNRRGFPAGMRSVIADFRETVYYEYDSLTWQTVSRYNEAAGVGYRRSLIGSAAG